MSSSARQTQYGSRWARPSLYVDGKAGCRGPMRAQIGKFTLSGTGLVRGLRQWRRKTSPSSTKTRGFTGGEIQGRLRREREGLHRSDLQRDAIPSPPISTDRAVVICPGDRVNDCLSSRMPAGRRRTTSRSPKAFTTDIEADRRPVYPGKGGTTTSPPSEHSDLADRVMKLLPPRPTARSPSSAHGMVRWWPSRSPADTGGGETSSRRCSYRPRWRPVRSGPNTFRSPSRSAGGCGDDDRG